MAVERFTTNFKVRTDIQGRLTPNFKRNDNPHPIEFPEGMWKPGFWLPIAFEKFQYQHGTDYFVIGSCKPVAFDYQGYLVPAGMRGLVRALNSTSATLLTYTATDFAQGVYDLTTGLRYATNGTTNYTVVQVCKALVERGLVPRDTDVDANDDTTTFEIADCIVVWEKFIGYMVGVIDYDVYKWHGNPVDGDQWFTNKDKQNGCQFRTEAYLEVPYRVAKSDGSTTVDVSVEEASAVTTAQAAGIFPAASQVWKKVALAGLARYNGVLVATDPVVGVVLDEFLVAKNTTRTPVASAETTLLIRERTSPGAVTRAGDWHLDADVGILFIHEDTWDALVLANTDFTVTYYYYDNGATEASTDLAWPYFDGEFLPGADLGIDTSSNYVPAGSTNDIYGGNRIIGQVYRLEVWPQGGLEKVKTAYELDEMPSAGKAPGSATGGYPTKIFHAGESVSNKVAILKIRV